MDVTDTKSQEVQCCEEDRAFRLEQVVDVLVIGGGQVERRVRPGELQPVLGPSGGNKICAVPPDSSESLIERS